MRKLAEIILFAVALSCAAVVTAEETPAGQPPPAAAVQAASTECALTGRHDSAELRLFADPFQNARPASCASCSICENSGDCSGGSCVPIRMSSVPCEEVCSLPPQVCNLSCKPCSAAPCGPGEGPCVAVLQAICLPEEECHLPAKVCNC